MSDGKIPASGPGGGGGGGQMTGDVGASGYAGQVVLTWAGGSAAANVLRFLLLVPLAGGVNGAVLARLTGTGTIDQMDVVYGTGGTLQLIGYHSGVAQFTSSAAGSYNGVPVIVSVELTPNGSSLNWALKTILPGISSSPTTVASGTVTSSSLGSATSALVNVSGTDTGTTVVGHVHVQYAVTSLTSLASVAAGYNGEKAADRFTRLCSEQGITATLEGNASDTPQLGPQMDGTLTSVFQGIEDFDRGQLFEARGFFGLTYRTRVNMQNQSPAVTYSYTSGELAQPLAPVADDQMTRNDVTVSRQGGSSSRQYLASGAMSISTPPNGVGDYTYSLTANAFADTQLANCATWILDVGTVPGNRYPQVNVDLTRTESHGNFQATAGMDIGDFFEITSPPSFAESATVKELAFGFTETMNAYKRTVTVNAVPEVPYEGGGLPSW